MTRQLRRAMEAPTMMPVPLDVLRVGDLITCGAVITGGSPNVYSG